MKAAQISQYGGPDVVRLNRNVPVPEIGDGQALVEVHAAGVNPFDNAVRRGDARSMKELDFPATLGGDFAGVISEIRNGAQSFKVGDEVYGQANALSGHGSFADFTPVNSGSVALKPNNINFTKAAALPLVGVSAYQALVEHLGLQKDQKILIHGGAGGIGSLAIQLAKHIGAYVSSTAASEDIEFVKGLGADEVIDYETQDFSTILKGYDAVFDTIGGDTYSKSFEVLKPGAKFVSMKHAPEGFTPPASIEVTNQFTRVTTERLDKLTELVESGALKVHIDKAFPLEQTGEAMAYLESGHHHGKVVVLVK